MVSKRLAFASFALAALSGCSGLRPIPVSEPPPYIADKDGKPTQARTEPDGAMGGLIPATTGSEAVKNIQIYSQWYQKQAEALKGKLYDTSDGALAGGIVGVIGGLGKSVETTLLGAGIAGGSSLVAGRYSIAVQAENYMKASDAMYCMFQSVKSSGLSDTSVDVAHANDQIWEVRRKLRKVQFDITLASPDFSNVLAKLEKVRSAQQQTKVVEAQLKDQETARIRTSLASAKIDELKANLEKCVAAF